MSKLKLATAFIADQNYESARDILEKEQRNTHNVYFLSLLYRYFNQMRKEQTLVEQAVSLGLSSQYIEERRKYYSLPIFEQLEPRQSLILPKDPARIASAGSLEQLCIVTGGGSDKPYFYLMTQLLESLEACPTYKNVRKGIIDCGLTDEDKNYLLKNFSNVEIKTPNLNFKLPDKVERFTQKGNWGILARPFMDKLFPGYRYYMWLDTDSWVQDERSLDNVLCDAENYKLGVVASHCGRVYAGSFWERWHKTPIVPEYMWQFLHDNPFPLLTASCFCIDAKNTDFFPKWGRYLEDQMEKNGFDWGNDEITFNYTVHKDFQVSRVNSLNYNFDLGGRGLPRLKLDEPDVLYSTLDEEVVGILHLCGMGLHKSYPLWPCLVHPSSFTEEVFQANRQRYQQIVQFCDAHKVMPDQVNAGSNSQITSCHFRVFPWRDKQSIMSALKKEAQICLQSN